MNCIEQYALATTNKERAAALKAAQEEFGCRFRVGEPIGPNVKYDDLPPGIVLSEGKKEWEWSYSATVRFRNLQDGLAWSTWEPVLPSYPLRPVLIVTYLP